MSKTWAMSDIHGRRDLFDKLMEHVGPDDLVYFLGDAVDRGPDGWNILKEILYDGRFIMLMGNHEDMLVDSWYEMKEYGHGYDALYIWMSNGGDPTYKQMEDDAQKVPEIIGILETLPLCTIHTNENGDEIFLSHSGENCWDDCPNEHDYMWDRTHFLDKMWHGKDNQYVVHGHTPIPFVMKAHKQTKAPHGAYRYCEGHKIDIDWGSADTGIAVMLDLDTFQSVVVFGEDIDGKAE